MTLVPMSGANILNLKFVGKIEASEFSVIMRNNAVTHYITNKSVTTFTIEIKVAYYTNLSFHCS
jgi:hypothetical protein